MEDKYMFDLDDGTRWLKVGLIGMNKILNSPIEASITLHNIPYSIFTDCWKTLEWEHTYSYKTGPELLDSFIIKNWHISTSYNAEYSALTVNKKVLKK